MRLKGLKDEDFINYKKPSMFLGTCSCNWKCCIEQKLDISICQNSSLSNSKVIDMPVELIFHRYISNPITKAIVLGGLEPFSQYNDILQLVSYFRENNCMDDFVIYTGFYKEELLTEILKLSSFKNIIVKFGRFIPNQSKHYDETLGVFLASKNQYAEKIS